MGRYWFVLAAAMIAAGFLVLATKGGAQSPTGQVQIASAQQGTTDALVEPTVELTWLQLLRKGGPVMYPLYLTSIIGFAVAIERAINLRRKKILPPGSVEKLRLATSRPGGAIMADELMSEFSHQNDPLARIVVAGLRRVESPLAEMEKAIEDAGEKEVDAMKRNCRILSVVATVAPLLGLLGTVTGMVRAFMTVAAREEALGRTELLAAGIYEALVTTVVGLVIAIPTIVLYHFFVDRIHRLVMEIDKLTADLVERIQAGRRKA